MPFFPEKSTSQSQMCVSLLEDLFCHKSWASVPLGTLSPAILVLPWEGTWVLNYFHKDTNGICVSHGSLLLWRPFKRTCWDGGNWADKLQLPHLPISWNCHLKPPSPQAAISQWLIIAGTIELGLYNSGLPWQTVSARELPSSPANTESHPAAWNATCPNLLPSFLLSQVSHQHGGPKTSSPVLSTSSPLYPITSVSSEAFGKSGIDVNITWTLWGFVRRIFPQRLDNLQLEKKESSILLVFTVLSRSTVRNLKMSSYPPSCPVREPHTISAPHTWADLPFLLGSSALWNSTSTSSILAPRASVYISPVFTFWVSPKQLPVTLSQPALLRLSSEIIFCGGCPFFGYTLERRAGYDIIVFQLQTHLHLFPNSQLSALERHSFRTPHFPRAQCLGGTRPSAQDLARLLRRCQPRCGCLRELGVSSSKFIQGVVRLPLRNWGPCVFSSCWPVSGPVGCPQVLATWSL